MASSSSRPSVVVIGAGVVGLTCAVNIQARLAQEEILQHIDVIIIAREWPAAVTGAPSRSSANYASMWAGAHARPIPATSPQLQREAAWFRQTMTRFDHLVEMNPWCGIKKVLGIEFLEAPDHSYEVQDATSFERETGLHRYRRLTTQELPEGVSLGFEYETYCINPQMYCAYLLRNFLVEGGKTVEDDLSSEMDAFKLRHGVRLVVNASGMGFNDGQCFPIRGQTVLTDLVNVTKTVTRQNRDGSWSFLIPRFFGGGTVVGGTKEPGDMRTGPDSTTRDKLLAAALVLEPYAQGDTEPQQAKRAESVTVIADIVGRRPARRDGMRLEAETHQAIGQDKEATILHVIHAYGVGGRGYELSWGIAQEAAGLALTKLKE